MGKRLIKNLSFGIVVYVVVYLFMVLFTCSPRILAEYGGVNVSHINENFEFPLEIFSWGLLIICTVCSGIDIGVSAKFKIKQKEAARLSKVLLVLILLVIVLVESSLLNYFLGHDFLVETDYGVQKFKGIELPMNAIADAIVSVCTFLFTGSSILENNSSENKTSEKDEEEK